MMAILQAARAHVLGLQLESAYSWGLNRAIFIAAAKRGFKGGASGKEGAKGGRTSRGAGVYYLGDDMAFKEEKEGVLRFTIGERSRRSRISKGRSSRGSVMPMLLRGKKRSST